VGKPVQKRPLEKPKHRWEDNIETDLSEVVWGDMDWVNLAQELL
jgi:hypothetical protein